MYYFKKISADLSFKNKRKLKKKTSFSYKHRMLKLTSDYASTQYYVQIFLKQANKL